MFVNKNTIFTDIEALIIDLLKDDNALSKESFVNELSSKLEEISIKYIGSDSYDGKTMLKYALNSSINIEVVLKKHFIYQVKIKVCKITWKLLKELDFIFKSEKTPSSTQ